MAKCNLYGDRWLMMDGFDFPREVDLYNLRFNEYRQSDNYKVLHLSCEPRPFRVSNREVIDNSSKFDLILTYDEELLSKCPNARLFLFGTSWISDDDAYICVPEKKKFEISFLCGDKNITDGHKARQELWKRQKEIITPHTFWISSQGPVESIDNNPVLPKDGGSKIQMLMSQFHIVIENTRENNYFSEKLMDTIKTNTIPIYYGCPNISNYFNIEGFFIANSVSEIIDICNKVNSDVYFNMLWAAQNNKEVGKKYTGSFEGRMVQEIVRNMA